MDFVLQMMDFVLQMMDFVLQMMDFVFKMMNLMQISRGEGPSGCSASGRRAAGDYR